MRNIGGKEEKVMNKDWQSFATSEKQALTSNENNDERNSSDSCLRFAVTFSK